MRSTDFAPQQGSKTQSSLRATTMETKAEQGGAGQPATRPESKSERGDKPQPESDRRSQ